MSSFLVAYGTGEGQTAKVADRIATVLADRGHDVSTERLREASTVDVEAFDAVLVGGPVVNRRHLPEVMAFVERNRERLGDRPTALFQLSLASALPLRSAREGAMDWVDRLIEEAGWRPDQVGLFAGALKYSQYDRPERLLFRLVSALTTGDTDTSLDYEYTDWEKVERFAAEFADHVEAERERSRPATLRKRVAGSRNRRRLAALGLAVLGLAVAAYLFTAGDHYRRPGPGFERGQRPRRDAIPEPPSE